MLESLMQQINPLACQNHLRRTHHHRGRLHRPGVGVYRVAVLELDMNIVPTAGERRKIKGIGNPSYLSPAGFNHRFYHFGATAYASASLVFKRFYVRFLRGPLPLIGKLHCKNTRRFQRSKDISYLPCESRIVDVLSDNVRNCHVKLTTREFFGCEPSFLCQLPHFLKGLWRYIKSIDFASTGMKLSHIVAVSHTDFKHFRSAPNVVGNVHRFPEGRPTVIRNVEVTRLGVAFVPPSFHHIHTPHFTRIPGQVQGVLPCSKA